MQTMLKQAFLIHARPYRDTSLLIDFFTKDNGFIRAISKGSRNKNKNNIRGLLQPFTPLLISWRGKTDLYYLNNIELYGQPFNFIFNQSKGINLLAIGLYINELLYYLCAKEPDLICHELYNDYNVLLNNLVLSSVSTNESSENYKVQIEILLREFELKLIETLGYGLRFNNIIASKYYSYNFQDGFYISNNDNINTLNISGDILLAIEARQWTHKDTLKKAKQLLRSIISYYTGDKEFHSRKLLFVE